MRWVGIQCKGKNENYQSVVSETELRAEALKAREFMPSLSEFILVTTAPDDAKTQETARTITQENEESDRPMSVAIWGWGTLQGEITRYPEALKAFHPDATPFTDQILTRLADVDEIKAGVDAIRITLESIKGAGTAITVRSDESTKEIEVIDRHLHAEIDGYRDLIREGRPRTAISLLERLRERCWDNASPRVRFRITTNIGAAKLQLGDEKGAAIDFLTARGYDQADKIGMANTALAYTLMGKQSEAVDAANDALQHDPNNQDAASYLIQAQINDLSVIDPFDLVPAALRNTVAVHTAAIFFLRRRGNPQWRDAAREAFSLFADSKEVKRFAAEAVLDAVSQARWFLLGEYTSYEGGMEELRHAAQTLQSAWDSFKSSEVPLDDVSLPHNLALAWRALGEYEFAAEVLDEVIERKKDSVESITMRATVHLALDQEDEALRLLQQRGLEDKTAMILEAEILMNRNPGLARQVLTNIKSRDDEDFAVSRSVLVVQSYLRENRNDEARSAIETLLKAHPGRTEVLLALFRLQHRTYDQEADETLTLIKAQLKPDTPFHDRFLVSEALNARGSYDEAVEVLDGKVDYSRDTPALQLFLTSLVNSDRRKQAHEVVKALPRAVKELPFYLRIQVAVHMARGDFICAEEAARHYLLLRPEELSMRLKWANILLRSGRDEEVRSFLEGSVERLDGSPSERMNLAILLGHFDFEERALRLGYEVFLRNRRDPNIHLQYVALLLRPNLPDFMNLEVNQISTDVAFVIANKRGEEDTYFVEANENLRIDERFIAPDHPLARKVEGLKTGDLFFIGEGSREGEEWCVKSIKHKYLDALHKSMERFQRQFPTEKGLERIVVDGTGQDSLQPVLQRVKQRHDAIEAAFDQYEQTPIPLELLTHSFGGDVIQVWHGIIVSGRSFRVCIGTVEERQAAIQAIVQNERRGCIVDALTFYIIRRLGLERAVIEICGPIGMTETSVDVFRSRHEEIRSQTGKPHMSVFWRNGKYYREEVTDEQLGRALQELEDDLHYISEYCRIVPAEGTRDLPADLRKMSEKVNRSFFDVLLAAQGSNMLLLTDDWAYRIFALQETGTKVSWLQPVLMLARDQNVISIKDYYKAITIMIENKLTFISVDSKTLLAAAEDEKKGEGHGFAKIVEGLGEPRADIASQIRVAAEFFRQIWKDNNTSLRQEAQTGKTLECLMRGRLDVFKSIVRALLLQTPYKGFEAYLFRWLKGHFLL